MPQQFKYFIPKTIKVKQAVQWFKNGDHPEDNCSMIEGSEGEFLSEGKVIRYFRHPNFPGTDICPECNAPYHEHGHLEASNSINSESIKVCPGDWILTGKNTGSYEVCTDKWFKDNYDQVSLTHYNLLRINEVQKG